uniref:Titin n=1 Tax=Nothoprocta perdicaria TaxID=30464 RepID=A0A8C6ZQN2_NOTPE
LDANMAREQHVKAGDTLRLSAVIKGVPFPKVSWKKEDHEVSPKADIEVTGVGSKLEIRNTVHEDGGVYSLTVENPAGSKTVSVKVVVLDVKLIEGLVVKAGTTVRLPAIMRGVPVPTAKWVTDDAEIKSEGRHKIETDDYSTVLTIKDCIRKDTGEYLLTVSNAAGSKTVALHLTVLDVPGPPTGPINILEVTPEHMVISWRHPKDDGGSPIINYIVEKRQSKKETWGVVSSGTSHTKIKIPRLQKGCEYIFRVRAENKIGIGAPLDSEPTVAKYTFDPPSPPGKPTVYDITENAATVAWTLPISDGGTPITGYILERREASGKWIRVNKTPILDMKYRVTGLFEGNTYEFRVLAENMVGLSKPSPSSDPIKASRPITPPGPPINPKLKDKTRETADLVWTKPLKDGGSPILGYIVECQKTGTTQWNRINKDELIRQCAFRVPGLIEGNEYKFRIKAVNIVGEGEPRELAETVLAKDILSPPEIRKTFVYLKWRRPDYDGGSPNLSYHVERKLKDSDEWERVHKGSIKETHYMVDKSDRKTWATVTAELKKTSFNIVNLVPGNEYFFRVTAVNEYGPGVPSDIPKPILASDPLSKYTFMHFLSFSFIFIPLLSIKIFHF